MLKLLSPRDGAEVSLQTEAQAAFAPGADGQPITLYDILVEKN